MFAEFINHVDETGGLKISREDAFALFDMELPPKAGRKSIQGRPTMTKGEKTFQKLVKKQQNSETRTLKSAFKTWNKTVCDQKKKAQKEAEKERKNAEKQAEKERKQAEKELKATKKQSEEEEKKNVTAEVLAIEEELRQATEALASIEAKRPRGRSPKGKKWDADAGEWVPKLELCPGVESVNQSTEHYRKKKESGEKLVCPHEGCDFSTCYSKNNLQQHIMAKHTADEDKPFQCTHCVKGFAQKKGLNRHMDSVH